jgi:hypothetical protein
MHCKTPLFPAEDQKMHTSKEDHEEDSGRRQQVLEAGSQKTEVRSRRSEIRSRKTETRTVTSRRVECLIPHPSSFISLRSLPSADAPKLPRLTPRGAFVTCGAATTYNTHHGYAPRTRMRAAVHGDKQRTRTVLTQVNKRIWAKRSCVYAGRSLAFHGPFYNFRFLPKEGRTTTRSSCHTLVLRKHRSFCRTSGFPAEIQGSRVTRESRLVKKHVAKPRQIVTF